MAPPDRPRQGQRQEHAFQESVLYITNLLDDLGRRERTETPSPAMPGLTLSPQVRSGGTGTSSPSAQGWLPDSCRAGPARSCRWSAPWKLAYLGFLGTNERFQRVAGASNGDPPRRSPNEQIERILCFLSDKDRDERYQALRERVLANQLNAGAQQHAGPDRRQLLLRCGWSRSTSPVGLPPPAAPEEHPDSFDGGTDRNALANEIKQTETTLKAATEGNQGPRIVQSLTDKLATMKERLANHKQAEENRELLRVEIDKTEQKTVQICEMGLASEQDRGGVLSQQVDGIAGSVAASEQALAGLNLSDLFDAERAPNLLQTGPAARMEKE
ncbi:MAG: hypothetical protein U1F87_04185 [Kiritimatiellia bacterium]